MRKVIKDILFKLMFNILKNYMTFTMIYQVFPERMKIVEKLVANLHDKTEYIIHTRKLRQALNRGLVLKNCIELLNLNEKLG